MNITEIQTASITSLEAAQSLAVAAQAAVEGKAQIDKGKAKGASALAVMVAGFSDDEAAMRAWTFDLKGNDGQVKYHVSCTGTDEHGGTTGEWRAEPTKAKTAYKGAFMAYWFNLANPIASVWTMASKAVLMARAIRQEGMTARIDNGVLVLEGGDTERAKAMREAKSMNELAKAAKGAAGTDRDTPQNGNGEADKDEGEGAARPATREEILRAAFAALNEVSCGDGPALNSAEASLIKGLARIASNMAKAEAAAEKAEKAEAARKAARNA
jgi:hypothetical protein